MSDLPTLETSCEQALSTHFKLSIEAWEIESLRQTQSQEASIEGFETTVRVQKRLKILNLGIRFLETTLEACEGCEHNSSNRNNTTCPSEYVLDFIRATLTK
jgi:hypothetical protein